MPMISNLEITKDFEFDHVFINDMVEKFALTPSLCSNYLAKCTLVKTTVERCSVVKCADRKMQC